jgi:hypothetical protein
MICVKSLLAPYPADEMTCLVGERAGRECEPNRADRGGIITLALATHPFSLPCRGSTGRITLNGETPGVFCDPGFPP